MSSNTPTSDNVGYGTWLFSKFIEPFRYTTSAEKSNVTNTVQKEDQIAFYKSRPDNKYANFKYTNN
jgi:hypothetical protein